MKKSISETRIEEILDSSLNLPIFINNEQGDTINAMYISNVGPPDAFGMPKYIQITRESLQGIITSSNYQLVNSVKQIVQAPDMN